MDNTVSHPQRSRDIPPGRYRDSNPSLRDVTSIEVDTLSERTATFEEGHQTLAVATP